MELISSDLRPGALEVAADGAVVQTPSPKKWLELTKNEVAPASAIDRALFCKEKDCFVYKILR